MQGILGIKRNNIVIIINFKFNLIYVRVATVAFVQKINFNERGALTSQQQQQQFTVSRWFVKRGSKKKIKLFKLYHETLPSPPLPVE